MKKIIIYLLFFYEFCFCQTQKISLLQGLAFGDNLFGQLGIGKKSFFDTPIQTLNISNIVKISAGHSHTLALKNDGTVWAWGKNLFGQLGDGTLISKSFPVQVQTIIGLDANANPILEPLTDIIDISAGEYHNLALKRDGTVWGWGFTLYGAIGYDIYDDRNKYKRFYATKIDGISDVWKISSGFVCSIALKRDGTVWGWGDNAYGQLAQDDLVGEGTISPDPVKIPNLNNIIYISAGADHVMAIKNTGDVYCWGLNYKGQIGDGTHSSERKPTKTKNITDVIDISAGLSFSIALKNDGTVWAWGDNYYGTLGDGTEMNDKDLPQLVQGLPKIKNISANYASVIAIDVDENVWTWGLCGEYILENGRLKSENRPIKINEFNGIKDASVGDHHQIFLKDDETVWGRMDNYYGQLGIGYFGYSPEPERIEKIDDLVQVSAGYLFSLGLKNDGTVWSWGHNYYGQLGCGEGGDELLYSFYPVQVLNLKNVIQISAGSEFGLALKNDGTVWAWGRNNYGQLGNGREVNPQSLPVKVMIDNVIAISAGHFHGLALKNDGTVWSWGYGGYGILGDGKEKSSNVPVQVKNLNNIISISAGEIHSTALKDDGTVWGWGGYNYFDWVNTLFPYQLPNLSKIVFVSAGAYHGLAVKDDGTLWGWGGNSLYELAEPSGYSTIYPPYQLSGLPKIKEAYAGNFYSMAKDEGGKFWAWGNNFSGQLGIGYSSTPINIPKEVLNLKDVISLSLGGFHALAIQKISSKKIDDFNNFYSFYYKSRRDFK